MIPFPRGNSFSDNMVVAMQRCVRSEILKTLDNPILQAGTLLMYFLMVVRQRSNFFGHRHYVDHCSGKTEYAHLLISSSYKKLITVLLHQNLRKKFLAFFFVH